MLRIICLICFTSFAAAWPALAATIAVPGDAPTIQKAIDQAASGDTVLIAPGEYTESLTLKDGVSLKGADRDTTIIRCLPTTGRVLTVTDCNSGGLANLTLEHLAEEVDPEGERIEVVVITDSTVEISNCVIRRGNGNGISIQGGGKSTVRGCLLTENGGNGITILDAARPIIENNEITKNNFSGIYFYRHCGGSAKNNRLMENELNGIVVDGAGARPLISGNIMRDNALNGLNIANSGAPTTLDNDYKHNGTIGEEEIKRLFSSKRFDDLEYIAERLRTNDMRFKNGNWQIEGFYDYVESGTDDMTEDEEGDYLGIIDEWKQEYPSSPTWRVALARAQISFGWHDRGSGSDDEVTADGGAKFYEHLALAWDALQESRALDANDPEVYASLVTVAMAIGDSLPQARTSIAGLLWNKATGKTSYEILEVRVFDEGIKQFPLYYPLYTKRVYSLLPRWGGHPEQIVRLAAESADATQELHGDGLYALIACEALEWEGDEDYTRFYDFSEERVIQGFKDLIERTEDDNWYQNGLARFACLARDKETAAAAFEELGESFNTGAWPTHLRFVEYREWANNGGEYPGQSQLGRAIEEGKLNRVARLLDVGKNPNRTVGDGDPFINQAVKEGHLEITKLLIEAGAHINKKSIQQKTPAYIAVEEGHNKLLELLLQNGADTEIATTAGWTPLIYAAYNSDYEGLRLLLKHGANSNAAITRQWTALRFAAKSGNEEAVRMLLEHDADPNIADIAGWSALHFAAKSNRTEMIKILLQHGADIEIILEDGWTPLMIAARYLRVEAVLLLLENGADVRLAHDSGKTALHFAAYGGGLEVVKLLVEAGVDVHATTDKGIDARRFALDEGHTEIAAYLEREMAKR